MHQLCLGERNSETIGHILGTQPALRQLHGLGVLWRYTSRHPQFFHFGTHALHLVAHALHFHLHIRTRQMFGQMLAEPTHARR